MLTLIHNPCRKKKFPDENLLLIETVFYLGREYIKFNEDYLIITRFRGPSRQDHRIAVSTMAEA